MLKSDWHSTKCIFNILLLHFSIVVSTSGGFLTTILVKESTTKPRLNLWWVKKSVKSSCTKSCKRYDLLRSINPLRFGECSLRFLWISFSVLSVNLNSSSILVFGCMMFRLLLGLKTREGIRQFALCNIRAGGVYHLKHCCWSHSYHYCMRSKWRSLFLLFFANFRPWCSNIFVAS